MVTFDEDFFFFLLKNAKDNYWGEREGLEYKLKI